MLDRREVAILVSGGIDSAVLSVDLTRHYSRVHPIYVRFGLRWETAELQGLRAFLHEVANPTLAPLVILDEPVSEVYGDHWSVRGSSVPNDESPDEAVYLPGRNLLLVTKAAVWCRLRGVELLALGSLAANPFPDSTPEFDRALERALTRGMGGSIRLIRPYDQLVKADVMRRAEGLPIASTFSCLDPIGGRHCGACNKCAERRRAFGSVGIPDPTSYARTPATAN